LRSQQSSAFLRRIGTVAIAIGLAFAAAAYLAQNTSNGPQFGLGNYFPFPAHTYNVVCCSPSFVSPNGFVYISVGPLNTSTTVNVYLMKTNESNFETPVSGSNSFPLNNSYRQDNSSLFLSYLLSHGNQLITEYNITRETSLQTRFYSDDVEPLMVVLVNAGDTNTTGPYSVIQNPVLIAPPLGFEAAAGLILAGGVLLAIDYALAYPSKSQEPG
jgi:hypothetical protein